LTTPEDRLKALGILDIAVAAGAWATGVAELLGVGLFTLQRWRRQFAGDGDGLDGRKGSPRQVYHRLTDEERQRILLTCNQPEFAALPPGQIVPILAERGWYHTSEKTASTAQSAASTGFCMPRVRSIAVAGDGRPRSHVRCGVWLYLYQVIDVWSRKVVAWDVAEQEEAQIAAGLVSRGCLRSGSARVAPTRWSSMPTTATPCVPPRWKAAWRSWVCSDPSPGRG
jgi:hypothetical protein